MDDLIASPALLRARMMQTVRTRLTERGFLEFATPVLRAKPGGRLTPRITTSDGEYLRDSPAFALRMCLEECDKVFELGPSFRPDEPSRSRLREFCMLDVYWANATLEDAIALARDLVVEHYEGPVVRVSVAQVLFDLLGVNLQSDPDGEAALHKLLAERFDKPSADYIELLDMFVENEITPLSEGKFVIADEFPIGAEVRAATKAGTFYVSDRAEFLIERTEVAHLYTDEHDSELLLERATAQDNLGPEDARMVELLRGGMTRPRSSGFGIGIERLCKVAHHSADVRSFWRTNGF